MPRKGSRKTKTGCLTCKIRKVKCDEKKPFCQRCTSTGRKCDGYPAQPPSSSSDESISIIEGQRYLGVFHVQSDEARALEYFGHVVAPILSGQFDGHFWRYLLPQLSQREPAVRHALVAISSVYEQFQDEAEALMRPQKNDLAVRHYNMAISEMRSSQDQALGLFMSVLFVCLEFLQGNKNEAITHCQHGIMMFNEAGPGMQWACDSLLPIFYRLTIFPLFFGSNVSTFPYLVALDRPMPDPFTTTVDAQASLDALLSRSVRFVRMIDEYRFGSQRDEAIPRALQEDQHIIDAALDKWQAAFARLDSKRPRTRESKLESATLGMRFLVAKIWVAAAPARRETAYDEHLADFQTIVNLGTQIAPSFHETRMAGVITETSPSSSSSQSPPPSSASAPAFATPARPKFVFEMGFLPLLYFVVMKCRSLETRLRALLLMKDLSVTRESLWDQAIMSSIGRRLIEIEHGISLDEIHLQSPLVQRMDMPIEDMRVMDSTVSAESKVRHDTRGNESAWRKVTYLLCRQPGESSGVRNEWIMIS